MNTEQWIQIIGTIAFTISGYLVGFRKRLDILGVLIVAFLSAIGGGMIRDVLISRVPLVFTQNTALIAIVLTLILAWLMRLQKRKQKALAFAFIAADALGLVAFSITGAQVGIHFGLNIFGIITLGFITATGGGIVRDMLVNEVPIILRQDLYGSIAILVSFLVYLLDQFHLINFMTLHLLLIAGFILRIQAWRYKWELPGFQKQTAK